MMTLITALSIIISILCVIAQVQGHSAVENLGDAIRSPIRNELRSPTTAYRLLEELTSAFNETDETDVDALFEEHDNDHVEEDHGNHNHNHNHNEVEEDHDNHNHNHNDIELHDEKHSESDDSEKPWGKVVGASLLINLTTIAGVVLIAGHWLRDLICPKAEMKKTSQVFLFEVLVPMFACGALLATTFFILLPESFHIVSAQFNGSGGHDDHRLLAEDDHDDHGDNEAAATWRWGSSIMGGFWIPLILHAFFTHEHNHGVEHENKHNTTEQQEEEDPEQGKTDKGHKDEFVMVCGLFRMKNVPLFVSYNLGELFHNFTDGIFVGVAFLGCSRDLQLSIMISTIYHELPNQLAGYLVMVNQCGMNPFVALFCNFVFGLSIMFGGLLVLAFDFNYVTIGCLLAMGGGTYLHVAISELLGNAQRNMKKGIEMIYMFIAFLVGAVPIGLILLNHHHC